jgi:hypothetical protein
MLYNLHANITSWNRPTAIQKSVVFLRNNLVPEMPVWTSWVMTMKDERNVFRVIEIYKNRIPQKLDLYAFFVGYK